MVTFKLGTPRLKPGSVPTIFPRFADPVSQAEIKRAAVVGGSRFTKAFSDYSEPSPQIRSSTKRSNDSSSATRPKSVLLHIPPSNGDCDECLAFSDGPCYEHASPSDYVFDKAPVPLAYASLPDCLSLSTAEIDNEDGLPVSSPEESITAKETLRVGMLFGPLIAPLSPLEEVEEPPRYVLWSEVTEDFQAYGLRDNHVCNWIKFIRPTSDFAQVNLFAYQQKDHIYFFTVKEVRLDTELRVFVKIASNCQVLDDWVSPLLDHLLNYREESECNEPSVENRDNDGDVDSPSPSAPACNSRNRKSKRTSNALTTREKYSREAKIRRVSYQQDEPMEYGAVEPDEESDEYGEYEKGEEVDSDDEINEADFEKLEEYEANKGSKRGGKKTRVKKASSAARQQQPSTLEEELLKIQKRKERKNERARVRGRPERNSIAFRRYKNNEMTDTERAAFEKWRERRRGYKKAAYRERTVINRRYANGEISLEEKKALEQERIKKGMEQSLLKRTGQEKLSNIEKAVDAVMNRGMSLREAKDLYGVGGWRTLESHLVKAGFHPSQAKGGTLVSSISTGSTDTTNVLEEP